LTEKGVEFESVNYIEKPLSAAGLKQLFQQAGLKPYEVLRTKEDAYRQHVAGKNLADDQLLAVMAKHPELIQRPIVLRGNKAVLAREIEKLGDLGIE
jgi:arsenate reductase (glutaredoxin)